MSFLRKQVMRAYPKPLWVSLLFLYCCQCCIGWHQHGYSDRRPTFLSCTKQDNDHYRYQIERCYPPLSDIDTDHFLLPRALLDLDPATFLTLSQAKKACRLGRILIFCRRDPQQECEERRANATCIENWKQIIMDQPHLDDNTVILLVGQANSTLLPGDQVALHTRVVKENTCYPVFTTQYILPPPQTATVQVVYQDHHLALVHKPENLTTIGSDRDDLQSTLGFVLNPPPELTATNNYHPRPVHRLDRRTSGLVLIAKSPLAMKRLSQAFAKRKVQKTYTALVFAVEDPASNTTIISQHVIDGQWQTIDYPIDGKPAVSYWRIVQVSSDDENNGQLALVEVRPHTGRMHQIRRHLSYCVQLPIVGDAKYDNGTRRLRTNGMYLSCHSLDFEYPIIDENENVHPQPNSNHNISWYEDNNGKLRMRVRISLPNKFQQRIQQGL
jgi:23S rRNA-/tRNA-specific pseudouridylate synthase